LAPAFIQATRLKPYKFTNSDIKDALMKTTSSFLGRPARQTGFTLIEALVVMIVGIIVLAGAAAGIGKLFTQSGITTEAENITQSFAAVRALRNSAGYADLDNMSVILLHALPASMTHTACTSTSTGGNVGATTAPECSITNSWGGSVAFAPANSGQAFAIEYTKVPEEACQQLAQKLPTMGWANIYVTASGTTPINKTVKPTFTAPTSGDITTADRATIITACSGGGKTVTFVSAN
jgi:hypothetical protein